MEGGREGWREGGRETDRWVKGNQEKGRSGGSPWTRTESESAKVKERKGG